MASDTTEGILAFLQRAENLKNTPRCAFTSTGKRESAAEHSWRLCLLVLLYARFFPELDREKCFKLAVVHDLPEAVCGDTPATERDGGEPMARRDNAARKSKEERLAMGEITRSLPRGMREELVALWEEYESAASGEALFVKALDKLETLIQHAQGLNPPEFDYAFNLTYGLDCTRALPFFDELRALIDRQTRARMRK